MNYLDIIIPFVGGLGMFIYGMQIMAQGLENAAGSKMKSLLEVLTKNKLMGVLLGAGITAVIQSSSATTVMVVGFVNAGIMNLKQAMGRYHGSKYWYDSDRMAGLLCRMGGIFKPGPSGADCSYGRCDPDAGGKTPFFKRDCQYHRRLWPFIYRNYDHVFGS